MAVLRRQTDVGRSKRQLLESLYGGQFTLSTPLIKPNFCILLPHRRNTTVSLETTPSFKCRRDLRVCISACIKDKGRNSDDEALKNNDFTMQMTPSSPKKEKKKKKKNQGPSVWS